MTTTPESPRYPAPIGVYIVTRTGERMNVEIRFGGTEDDGYEVWWIDEPICAGEQIGVDEWQPGRNVLRVSEAHPFCPREMHNHDNDAFNAIVAANHLDGS